MSFVILLLLLIFSNSSFACDYKEELNRINQDLKEFSIATEKNEILIGITLTSLSFFLEEETNQFIQKNKSDKKRILAETGNIIGNPIINFAVPFTIYSLSDKNTKLAKSSLSAGEAVFFSTLIAGVSSIAIGRHRPYKKEGKHNYEPFSFDSNDSLPSKHLASSTALFTTYAKYYDLPILYIFPVLTAFGRVYEDKHYLADTIAGATIGYIVADYIYKKEKERENKSIPTPFLSLSKNGMLLGFSYKF